MLGLLILLFAGVGFGVLAFGAPLGRRALTVGVLPLVATFAWLLWHTPALIDGQVFTEQWSWVPGLDLTISLRIDAFGAVMVSLVSGIGILVYAFSARYFPSQAEGLTRLIGLLTLFAGSMFGLVSADNVIVLYAFWEMTSVTSYFLIANDYQDPSARAAALQALLITAAGALAMLAGFVIIGVSAGTFQLSEILARPPSGTAVGVALALVLVGAITKSAQYPFHSWLPGAMVAPTPVSAYLHSATMVKAGVYLVARFAPAFVVIYGWWRPTIVGVGLATMIFGGLRALRQYDLKLLLAYGTISQLGFMFLLFGIGVPEATYAGCALILAHGLFKAALFMVVGIVDHEVGTRDIRALDRFGPQWAPIRLLTIVGAASMAGVPLTFGFIAKEAAFESIQHGDIAGGALVLVGVVAGSALTFAYALRFVWGAFYSRAQDERRAEASYTRAAPGMLFTLPVLVLAALTVLWGVIPQLISPIEQAAGTALVPGFVPEPLALWHGLTVPLVLSVLTYVAGTALFVARRPVGALLATGQRIPSGTDVYAAGLRLLNGGADRVTAVVQNGSLAVYLAVILLTAALAPGIALVSTGDWPGFPPWFGPPVQMVVVAILVSCALAAAIVRKRFGAALLLGAVGYCMAALFVLQGAPDVALTQAAIETLSTVLFVLVLRRLPDRFERSSPPLRRVLRLVVAGAVGVTVFVFAIYATANRTADPVSEQMVADALPEGDGRNVVNVILVDFRGFDTMGEITVLAAAAIGAVALARAGRRPPGVAPKPSVPIEEPLA